MSDTKKKPAGDDAPGPDLLTTRPWELVGLSRGTWRRLVAAGTAPPPLDLPAPFRRRWRAGDVRAWAAGLG